MAPAQGKASLPSSRDLFAEPMNTIKLGFGNGSAASCGRQRVLAFFSVVSWDQVRFVTVSTTVFDSRCTS